MAEAYKINFYPKPAPPTKPKVKSFEEIQRLLAQAPATPTHEPGLETQTSKYKTNGPQKVAIQHPYCGSHQFR